MSTLAFLRAVLPHDGAYCVVELSSKAKQHIFCETIEEVQSHGLTFDAQRKDAYFALASFKEEKTRKADNALSLRSLFIDLDVGEKKGYRTRKEAAAALVTFVNVAALETPWVVSSGGGIHAYWPLDRDVPVQEWKLVAERFKRFCLQHELRIDLDVTADAARVLRIPGTHNYKLAGNPRPVELKREGTTTAFDALRERLRTEVEWHPPTPSPLPMLTGAPPIPHAGATGLSLVKEHRKRFKRLLDATVSGAGCAQLRAYLENAADDGMEPLWRAMLSIAKFTEDADRAAKFISRQHPYSEDRMHTKLREIRGPYTCVKIDGINPGVCGKCPKWQRIASPIVLAIAVEEDTEEKTVTVDGGAAEAVQESKESIEAAPISLDALLTAPLNGLRTLRESADAESQIVYRRPPPPKGFFYGTDGGVYARIRTTDAEGAVEFQDVCVIPYDLFVTASLASGVDNSIHLIAAQPGGTKEVVIPARALVSKDDTLKSLGGELVYAHNNTDKLLYDYVKRSASELTVKHAPRKVPDTYGWQSSGGFVINGKEFLPDEVRSVPTKMEHANLLSVTAPAGSLAQWRRVVDLIATKDRPDILLAMCTSFGAPLMELTGFNGLCVHVQSHQTGTGKSVTLNLAASVYGHPTEYWVTCDTSVVTTQLRMGNLHSLPLIMDEVTYKTREMSGGDPDWVGKFLLDLTIGKSKERMESNTTRERRNTVRWSTLCLFGSNSSMVDALTSRSYTTNGELQRLLEIEMHSKLTFAEDEGSLFNTIFSNYGVAGQVYLRWLVANKETAQGVLNAVREGLTKKFALQGHERFWLNGLAAMLAGAILASARYAGIVNLPIESLIKEAGTILRRSRRIVSGNTRTAADVLHAYIRNNYGQFVIIRKRGDELSASLGASAVVDESTTRTTVRGRIEHGFKEGVALVYIERVLLNSHCHAMSYNSAAFKRELSEKYVVADNVKKFMLAHTRLKSPRAVTLCIEMPEDELESRYEDEDAGSEAKEKAASAAEEALKAAPRPHRDSHHSASA